jgi:hypothetical protein
MKCSYANNGWLRDSKRGTLTFIILIQYTWKSHCSISIMNTLLPPSCELNWDVCARRLNLRKLGQVRLSNYDIIDTTVLKCGEYADADLQ